MSRDAIIERLCSASTSLLTSPISASNCCRSSKPPIFILIRYCFFYFYLADILDFQVCICVYMCVCESVYGVACVCMSVCF